MTKNGKRRVKHIRGAAKKGRRATKAKREGSGRKTDELFGFMVGRMKILGDIESPIPGWFAEKKK